MAQQGFDWTPSAPYVGDVFGREGDRRYRYVTTSRVAARYGYHLVPLSGGPDPDQPPLTEEEEIALFGDDPWAEEPGGCTGMAINHLAGDLEHVAAGGINLPDAVFEVNFNAYLESQRDPQVLDALDDWSTCMAGRGYAITDPVNYYPNEWDIDSPHPSRAEVKMALSDVSCQRRTDIINTWLRVDSTIQQRMIDERAELFAQIAQQNEVLLGRAAKVIDN